MVVEGTLYISETIFTEGAMVVLHQRAVASCVMRAGPLVSFFISKTHIRLHLNTYGGWR